tara:strand:- start:1423 stop:2151 length:729 start_codon:yes stop_codon:yes gene_type:complete
MSFGGSSGSQVTTQELTPEQRAMIGAQTNFFTSTIAPAYQQTVGGAQDIYNNSTQGVNYAAQNLAGISGQAQEALGSTGESALRTGISGLENLFGADYERQQLSAALVPAQQQYQSNLAAQQAQFGGAGQMGSARQALANTALAGQTQASQQQAAAQVSANIAQQRAGAAGQLAQLGQGGLGQAMGAASQGVTAAGTPQDFYNKYASVLFGTPATSYSPNFAGTQGSTINKTGFEAGVKFGL